MAMKFYKRLIWGKERCFKWEWSIHYEYNVNHMYRANQFWRKGFSVFPNRVSMRKALRTEFSPQCRPNKFRNIKVKRRLVQVHWDDFNDSFTYNAKGNGNGR